MVHPGAAFVGFRAADDDVGVSATDTVTVLITGTSTQRSPLVTGSSGTGKNGFFPDDTLDCYLGIVGFVSDVFHEETDTSDDSVRAQRPQAGREHVRDRAVRPPAPGGAA